MKQILFLMLLAIAGTFTHAQDSTTTTANPRTAAKIIFMRATGFNGSATAFTTFIDDALVCRLNNKRFSTHLVPPGEHHVSVQFAGKESKGKAEHITIETEGGKTYYIQLVFQPGAFVNNLYCQEVTQNSANLILPTLKEDTKCL